MTKTLQEAREILANGCGTAQQYLSASTKKTCAIGTLALASGMSEDYLLIQGAVSIQHLPELAKRLCDEFPGLTQTDLYALQIANDSVEHSVQRRRDVVLHVMDEIIARESHDRP